MSQRIAWAEDDLRAEIQAEASRLFGDLMSRGDDLEASLVAAVGAGDPRAAEALLCMAGVLDEVRDCLVHPLVVCRVALGAWTEIVKTWDDPWTWPPLSYLYPLRHPLLWLYQHSGLVRQLWDRRIRERVRRDATNAAPPADR